MSVQTTLFGKALKGYHGRIYANPKSRYEQFVERWYQRHKQTKCKEEIVREAQAEWNKMKHSNSAIDAYIAPQGEETDFSDVIEEGRQVRNYGFEVVEILSKSSESDSEADVMIVDEQCSSKPSSSFPACTSTKLFSVLCPDIHILTEDVVNNKSFMSCVKSVESSILYFLHLRNQYASHKQRTRQSALKSDLERVDTDISAVINDIKKVASLRLTPSQGLDNLARTCTQKQEMLAAVAQSLLALKSVVSSPSLLNNLRRRLKQQDKTIPEEYIVQCFHTPDYNWENAYQQLDISENTGLTSYPLNYSKLRQAGVLLEEALAMPLTDIVSIFEVSPPVSRTLTIQLLKAFPVLMVSLGNQSVLINCHELLMSDDSFEKLLLLDKKQAKRAQTTRKRKKPTTSTKVSSGATGRPSLVSKFPDIVTCATSFIKAHGFRAHERRREEVGKVGVSLREIREHLLANVPNLQSHDISLSTVSRLMEPPHRGTIASGRYKRLVQARVPGKRNEYREAHKDQHYLFAQVAYRKEFCSMFDKECAIFSCDDMNKIKVGVLAVSRYHQIERYFPVEDAPNVPDHDFPVPGYHIIPSGYMRLMKKEVCTSLLEGADLSEYQDQGINDVCNATVEPTNNPGQAQTSLTTCMDAVQPSISYSTSLQAHSSLITSVGAVHPLTSYTTSLQAKSTLTTSLDIIKPINSPYSSPVTKVTTNASLADSTVSIEVQSRGVNGHPTTLTVEVCDGTVSHVVSLSNVPTSSTHPSSTVTDSIGRPHFKTPYTGPTKIVLRSARFHSSTSESHISDLKPLIQSVILEGRTVVTLIVDGGPDWSTASQLNAMYYMRLWRDCNLDMLCITSFAARFSAYNPIEHLWAPMSKRLSSVFLSAIAEGDSKPPCYISGLSNDEKIAKESAVFDRAISEIADVHWKDASFDSFPVVTVPVKSNRDFTSSDHDVISQFLKASLKKLRDGTYKTLLDENKFLLAHVRRHHNELIFLKCEDSQCSHCLEHPIRANEAFSFLRKWDMRMFYPLPSVQHPGHFCTFLEMCNQTSANLPVADQYLPTSVDNQLGYCPHCREYVFLSKTEKKRHFQVFHPRRSTPKEKNTPSRREFQCTYKLQSGQVCGKLFCNIYQLSKHRKVAQHQRKRRTQKQRYKYPSPIVEQYVSRVKQVKEIEMVDETEEMCEEACVIEDIEKLDSESKDVFTDIDDDVDKELEEEKESEESFGEACVYMDNESEEVGGETCVMCGLDEEDDEEMEVWIECTKCLRWVHEFCLPPSHPHSADDLEFLCPDCTTKKSRRFRI